MVEDHLSRHQETSATSNIGNVSATVLDSLPVAVYNCDKEGFITLFNKAAADLWGRRPLIGTEKWSGALRMFKVTGEPLPHDQCPLALSLKTGAVVDGETMEVERPDGSRTTVKTHPVLQVNPSGEITGAVNTLIDVSMQAEGEHRQARLAAIVDTSDDTIISKTLQGIITSWNKAAERMFGYMEDEVMGKHISILIPKELLHEEEFIIGNIRQGRKIEHHQTTWITKDGRRIPILLTVSPILDGEGNIIGASKIARDISGIKTAEEKQAMLAAIVDTSQDTILSKTLKGIITSWNRAAEKMFGYRPEEVIGKHISLLIPPDRLKEEEYIIGRVSQGLKVDHFETIRLTKAGKEIPISLSVSPIMDNNGNIIGASKIARDVSAQHLAKQASQRYTDSLETINLMVQAISEELDVKKILQKVTDVTTQLTGAQFGAFFYNTVNEAGESFMLYTLSGAPLSAFEKFGMPRNTAVFHTTFSGGGVMRVDDITKDPRYGKSAPHFGMPEGHLPVVSYLAVPVIARSGVVIGGLFFGHPQPAMFNAEHESIIKAIAAQAAVAIENARMFEEIKALNEKKDEFIGLASHELKTPLTSITGYLQILERQKIDETSKRFVSKTVHQVRKLTALVSDLLDVSKIEAGKLQFNNDRIDVSALVEEAIELIHHSYDNHPISVEWGARPCFVIGDAQRIEQVLINLLTNAIKYSPQANEIHVVMKCEDDKAIIGVKDNGYGIAPDHLTKIFSRFYRVENANPNISGLGIGLYLSAEIIERHNGEIWAESVLGQGSTFWFSLPAVS